jgi:hypothetical protein
MVDKGSAIRMAPHSPAAMGTKLAPGGPYQIDPDREPQSFADPERLSAGQGPFGRSQPGEKHVDAYALIECRGRRLDLRGARRGGAVEP